jgi:hypothetical protein
MVNNLKTKLSDSYVRKKIVMKKHKRCLVLTIFQELIKLIQPKRLRFDSE